MEAVQDYEALKASLLEAANEHGEPHWLADRRTAAVDAMVDLPLPEVRRFDYHRWPLTPIDPLQWQRSDKAWQPGLSLMTPTFSLSRLVKQRWRLIYQMN